jgi:hypothetical protein
VTVKSANAAKRVMASLIRFCEGRLQLVVNRAKSRAAPLKSCEFLSYKLDHRAKLVWTDKAQRRFKERIREPERSGDRLPGGPPREGWAKRIKWCDSR